MDDLIVYGNDIVALTTFKKYLCSRFHMKDLGVLKYFLGIEVTRKTKEIYLCQRSYALDIITELDYLGSKHVHFPMEQNHKLATSSSPIIDNVKQYRMLVGRLIYLSFTRPNFAYSVHILSQFLGAPCRDHCDATILVRYLKGSPGQGILLCVDCDMSLSGWCDPNWLVILLIVACYQVRHSFFILPFHGKPRRKL